MPEHPHLYLASFKNSASPVTLNSIVRDENMVQFLSCFLAVGCDLQTETEEPAPESRSELWLWLWSHCTFDLDALVHSYGQTEEYTLNKLAQAKMNQWIYPDGTVQKYIDQYLKALIAAEFSELAGKTRKKTERPEDKPEDKKTA